LRPDGTIPVARLYIDSMQDKDLAKLCYITNIFMFEETGKEAREKWQCGAELIGGGSPLADAELMILALEVLSRLGVDNVEIRLSHAGVIRALLAKLELSPDEQNRVFDRILDGDIKVLSRLEAKKGKLGRALPMMLDLRGKSSGFLRNLNALFAQDLPGLEPHLDNFADIVDSLEALGVRYQIDLTSGRGFEYYTGVMFQVFAGKEKIGGGGRYDALIPLMGGRDIPASGFALYLDRLMAMMKPETAASPRVQRILVRVDYGEQSVIKDGFGIANRLRQAGCVAELDLGGAKAAEMDWTLEVKGGKPRFVLTDQVKSKKYEAQTDGEVLKLLGF